MDSKVLMPKLGKTMTEGVLVAWKKKAGEAVADGDVLFVVNNGKNEFEIEATVDGVVKEILVEAGKNVPVATEIAIIEKTEANAPKSKLAATKKMAEAAGDTQSVIVIGGGPGGYVAAIRSAQLGAKVTLIERAKIGGTCLNRGCMPTKALMHSSEIYESAVSSQNLGIIANDVSFDWEKVQANRESVSGCLSSGVKALIKANKITLIEGNAVFTGPKSVKAGDKEISADKIIIATGSRPSIPNIPGLKTSNAFMDSTDCLTLDHVPESMLVIGGGVIGLELGLVYLRFGAKVTVIEMQPKLLPLMDGELTAMLRAKLESAGMEILTCAQVVSVEDTEAGTIVKVSCKDGEKEFSAEKILVSVGRTPELEGLGLDRAGVKTENGYICANEKMETSVNGVYAVGDCNGKLMLAHAAMVMGETAADNAMGGNKTFDATESPACAFIGPEFASVGFTEAQAKDLGLDYKVGRFPTSANGKSLVEGEIDGMIKVVAGRQYGEILGVHILAPRATDLIGEAALAIKLECTLEEYADTIHCHPTVSEAVRECVLATEKRAIHIPNKK